MTYDSGRLDHLPMDSGGVSDDEQLVTCDGCGFDFEPHDVKQCVTCVAATLCVECRREPCPSCHEMNAAERQQARLEAQEDR